MIQRIQSIWLVLAAVAGIFLFKLPLWEGTLQDGSIKIFAGMDSLLLFALIITACILSLIAIFLFRNRKLQKRLSFLAILASIAIIILEFVQVEKLSSTLNFKESRWQFGAVLPILMVIFLMLAYGAIRKDEKLVKSLERLR